MADKWWVCDQCKSLNDLPAKKCYKCRSPKPSGAQVVNPVADLTGGQPQRVGVTVSRSDVQQLMAPDPTERVVGGTGVFEDYASQDDRPIESQRGPAAVPADTPALRPLREPPPRGIDALGGIHWEEGLVDTPRPWPGPGPGSAPPASGGRPLPPPQDGPRTSASGMPSTGVPAHPWPPGPPMPPGAMPPGAMSPGAMSPGPPPPMPPGTPPRPFPPGAPLPPRPMPPGMPQPPSPGVPSSAGTPPPGWPLQESASGAPGSPQRGWPEPPAPGQAGPAPLPNDRDAGTG